MAHKSRYAGITEEQAILMWLEEARQERKREVYIVQTASSCRMLEDVGARGGVIDTGHRTHRYGGLDA